MKKNLKGLFDEMDAEKYKSKKNKNGVNGKTKATKPDFPSEIQSVQNGIYGMGLTSSNQYKGLTNYGNTCYSNVVMQCLISLKEFHNMLNTLFKKIEDFDTIEYDYPILFNLVKIMNYYQSI